MAEIKTLDVHDEAHNWEVFRLGGVTETKGFQVHVHGV